MQHRHDITLTMKAESKAKGHPPSTKVEVLVGAEWRPGIVHKEISDARLSQRDHGDVLHTTTWVVAMDDGGWWRGDMSEHIRRR